MYSILETSKKWNLLEEERIKAKKRTQLELGLIQYLGLLNIDAEAVINHNPCAQRISNT